jgi:hypothetical protein
MPNQPTGICRNGSGVCTGFYWDPNSNLHFVNDPANCHAGSWCARAQLSSGIALSSTQDWEAGYTPGNIAQGCSTSSGPNSNCLARHWFFRFWIKFDSNFRFITAPGRTTCQGKIFYARDFGTFPPDGGGNTNGSTVIIVFRPVVQTAPGSSAMTLNLENTLNPVPTSSFQIQADGLWHEVELEINSNPGQGLIRLWWDAATNPNPMLSFNTDFRHPMTVDNNHWGLYVNNNVGADACAVVNNTSFWIDDLAVSTQRIGGGAVSPPLTPSNLRLGLLMLGLAGLAVVVTLRRTP